MSSFTKKPYPPHGWSYWKFQKRVMGVSKAKYFKGKYEAKLEFAEGGGGRGAIRLPVVNY